MLKIGAVYKLDFDGNHHGYTKNIFYTPDEYCHHDMGAVVKTNLVTILDIKIHKFEQYGEHWVILCLAGNTIITFVKEINKINDFELIC